MGDGCSLHRGISGKKRISDFDEIDEFSNDQTKKAFHESLSEMGPTSCVFFVSFSFSFLFSYVFSSRGRERKESRKKIGVLKKLT